MARHFRDRLALTFAFWSLIFVAGTGALAWKFGWLPMEMRKSDSDVASEKKDGKFARRKALAATETPAEPVDSPDALPEWGQDEQVEPALKENAVEPPDYAAAPSSGRNAAASASPAAEPWETEAPVSRPMTSARVPSKSFTEIAPELPASNRPAQLDPSIASANGNRRRSSGAIDYDTIPTEAPPAALETSGDVTIIRPERSANREEADPRAGEPEFADTESEPEPRPAPRRQRNTARMIRDDGFSEPAPRRGVKPTAGENEPASKPSGVTMGDPRLQEVSRLLDSGERLPAHKEMSRLYWKNPELISQLQTTIDENARMIYFSSQPHFMEPYIVEPGDQLSRIAKKYSVSWEYLAKLNQIDPKKIRAGQRLKVIKGPFAAQVDLSDFALIIHAHGFYVKRYEIGIGKDDSTPTGKFTVKTKLVNPTYYGPNGFVVDKDDPSNPLGERWIDLGETYGIHGTVDPKSIGKAESRGCIRLRNGDIEEVFDLLTEGSEVIIRK